MITDNLSMLEIISLRQTCRNLSTRLHHVTLTKAFKYRSPHNGLTALHLAAKNGNSVMALYLLSHGASLSARCPFWLTFPLHVAVYSGYCTMVQLLLDCGADVNAGLSSGNNWSSNTGTTPLHIAARVGSPEMIQLLIEYGADVYAVASITGRTPLHIACARGDAEIIRLLILNGAPVTARDNGYFKTRTPLSLLRRKRDRVRACFWRARRWWKEAVTKKTKSS